MNCFYVGEHPTYLSVQPDSDHFWDLYMTKIWSPDEYWHDGNYGGKQDMPLPMTYMILPNP